MPDVDPATLPNDTRDGEADPGGDDDEILGANDPDDGGDDAADLPVNEYVQEDEQ